MVCLAAFFLQGVVLALERQHRAVKLGHSDELFSGFLDFLLKFVHSDSELLHIGKVELHFGLQALALFGHNLGDLLVEEEAIHLGGVEATVLEELAQVHVFLAHELQLFEALVHIFRYQHFADFKLLILFSGLAKRFSLFPNRGSLLFENAFRRVGNFGFCENIH